MTVRELERSDIEPPAGKPILETGVFGESRYGQAVYAGPETPLAAILAIVSDGSFLPRGRRDDLTPGQRSQLRDAMILETHVRERRDVFVTNDVRGFVGRDGAKRRELEELLETRIMTVAEFCAHLETLPG